MHPFTITPRATRRQGESGGEADGWVEWSTEKKRGSGAERRELPVSVFCDGEGKVRNPRVCLREIAVPWWEIQRPGEKTEEAHEEKSSEGGERPNNRLTASRNRTEDCYSALFEQAGFHSDNMGAVVGTLTMQTKQRRPSRGMSTLARGKGKIW